MTINKRVLIEFRDCLALQMTCECGASISVPFSSNKRDTVPGKCPNCDTLWFEKRNSERDAFSALYIAMKEVKRFEEFEKTVCKFHLEIKPSE